MPNVKLYTIYGKQVFAPRPINYEDELDAPRLNIIVVPASNFLLPDGLPNIPVVSVLEPAIAGCDIAISDNETLRVPSFYDVSAFPEPEVVGVEATDDDATAAPVSHGLNDDTSSRPVATGVPHAMTAAERQVLELEATAFEERRRQRLHNVRAHSVDDVEPDDAGSVAASEQVDGEPATFEYPPVLGANKDKEKKPIPRVGKPVEGDKGPA